MNLFADTLEEIVEMHVFTFDGNRISQYDALARRKR